MTMPAIQWPDFLQAEELEGTEAFGSRANKIRLASSSTATPQRFSGAGDEDVELESPAFESARGRAFAERGFVRTNRHASLAKR